MKPATVNIYATCILLAGAGRAFGAPVGAGVLLLGRSGSGKSDLALRLIAVGAKLVSDDRTDLYVSRGALWARAPRRIAGLIEVRGVGILALAHAPRARIALAVELGRAPRHPDRRIFKPPSTLVLPESGAVPLLKIAPFEASAPAKIAVAVAAYAHGLHREDVNPI